MRSFYIKTPGGALSASPGSCSCPVYLITWRHLDDRELSQLPSTCDPSSPTAGVTRCEAWNNPHLLQADEQHLWPRAAGQRSSRTICFFNYPAIQAEKKVLLGRLTRKWKTQNWKDEEGILAKLPYSSHKQWSDRLFGLSRKLPCQRKVLRTRSICCPVSSGVAAIQVAQSWSRKNGRAVSVGGTMLFLMHVWWKFLCCVLIVDCAFYNKKKVLSLVFSLCPPRKGLFYCCFLLFWSKKKTKIQHRAVWFSLRLLDKCNLS